jgi:hypothetical protein
VADFPTTLAISIITAIQTESGGDIQYLDFNNSIDPSPCRGVLFLQHQGQEVYRIARVLEELAAESKETKYLGHVMRV